MTESIPKKPLKKGSLVFIDRDNYIKSIEALASDDDLPNYVFEGPGEILSVKDEYAQVRWRRPCLLYTSPSPRDYGTSRMPSSA